MHMLIKHSDFILLRDFIYERAGIYLKDSKNVLLTNRLTKRMRELNILTIPDYIKYLFAHPKVEIQHFIDVVTTNETYFFREEKHWNFLTNVIIPKKIQTKDKSLKIWSAASSTGEEAYTILLLLYENIPDIFNWKIEIFATDINSKVIEKAKEAIFTANSLRLVPDNIKNKYFIEKNNNYYLKNIYKNKINFVKHNILEPFIQSEFDIIICRNVYIYFSVESKEKSINNLLKSLKRNGYFFIGHSENLDEAKFNLKYVDTAVLQFR